MSSREEQDQLTNKLAALEKKIIVGGENLLEKAEEQERMLEESAKELEARKVKEEALRKALQEKEVGMVQIQHAVRYIVHVHWKSTLLQVLCSQYVKHIVVYQ